MKEPRKDDERLSALLEGRVDDRQREELLAHLAASDDDYDVFTDTAAVLRALEEEDAAAAQPSASAAQPAAEAEPAVIPLRRARRGWRSPARLAMAAAAAGVVLVSALVLRERASGAAGPVQLAALADAGRQGLPTEWDGEPWSSGRGGESDAERRARAARAGAMLLDLSVAVRAGDSALTREVATRVIRRFDEAAGPDTPLRQIQARAGAPPESLVPLLDSATERLTDRLRADGWLELGAWIQAARLAARRQNEPFFRDRNTKAMLRRAERLTRQDADAQAAIIQIRNAIPAEGIPRWGSLVPALDKVLGAIASDEGIAAETPHTEPPKGSSPGDST